MSRVAHEGTSLPRLRLSQAEFAVMPLGWPIALDTRDKRSVGTRYKEIGLHGIIVREFRGVGPDGYLINTYKPVIRVRAVSRLVPRPEAVA